MIISSLCTFTSVAYAGTFEQGLDFFKKHDYAKARKLWQPLAKQGDLRAQYNLALTWLNDEKQPLKAKEYLAMSRSHGLVDGYFLIVSGKKNSQDVSPHSKSNATSKNDSLTWLNQQDKRYYTLQLATASKRQHIENMQKKLRLNKQLKQTDNLHIHSVQSLAKKGEKQVSSTRYVLIYGVFNSYKQAKDEAAKLPESLKKSSPWIRQFGILQSIANQATIN